MWSIICKYLICDFSYVFFSLYDEFIYTPDIKYLNFENKINK